MFNKIDRKIEIAYEYIHNDTQEALDMFNEVLEEEPENIDAINGKASSLMKLKRNDEAEKYFKHSLSLQENSSALINLGIINKNKQEYEKALYYFDNAIQFNPQLSDIVTVFKKEIMKHLQLKDTDIKLGNFNKQSNKLIKEGLRSEKEGQYWDAVEYYEKAIQEDSTAKDFVNSLIKKLKLYLQHDFLFEEIIIEETSMGSLKRKALKTLLIEERPANALKLIEEVLKIDPTDLDMLNYKGALEFYFEDYEESIKCFNKCLEINPEYVYALFNKGLVLRRLKNYQEALICFDKVLENPENQDKVKPYQKSVLTKLVKTNNI